MIATVEEIGKDVLLTLHNTIQRLIYERGNISPREVDITFEAPTRERIDTLVRPAINLFLFDLQENTELRQGDFERARSNGRAERRAPPRRFDLRYMVSALTTEIEDEHELIWRVLLTLLRHPQFPAELLPDELRTLEPPLTTRVSQSNEEQRMAAIWNALGAPPHPSLCYVVTVPVDMNMVIEAPLVLTRTARYARSRVNGAATEAGIQIGGIVRNVQGQPLVGVGVALDGRAAPGFETDEEGRFVLAGVPTGAVKLRVTPPGAAHQIVTVDVPEALHGAPSQPEHPYDIVLDGAAT
jgi:hypothetical protein